MSDLQTSLAALRTRPPRWAQQASLPPLRWQDGSPLSAPALRGFLADLKREGPDSSATLARQALSQIQAGDAPPLLRALQQHWRQAGEPAADRRWLTYAAALLGDGDDIERLGDQVAVEISAGRHRTAADGLEALQRQGSAAAQRWLGHWARRAPTLALRSAAWAARLALETPAPPPLRLDLPRLGFDDQGLQSWPHGGRTLLLRLDPQNALQLFEGSRPLKTIPPPRKADDPAQVAASHAALRALQGQWKRSLAALHDALEEAMVLGRVIADAATALHRPLAYLASRGLIYENPDGSRLFWSDEGEALDIDGRPTVAAPALRIAHPLDIPPPQRQTWLDLLADARVVQPFAQLLRPVRPQPDPPARQLARCPALSAAQLARGLQALGYIADSRAEGWVEQSLRFVGPYQIIVLHDPYPPNPAAWESLRRPLRLLQLEIYRGTAPMSWEDAPPLLTSEIAAQIDALTRTQR